MVVIAATNRPDKLDEALLRAGRFDRLLYIPPPDATARQAILKVHTRRMPLAADIDLHSLADQMSGCVNIKLEVDLRVISLPHRCSRSYKTGQLLINLQTSIKPERL